MLRFFSVIVLSCCSLCCSEKGRTVEKGVQELGEVKKYDGTYLGTALGVHNSSNLFSEIIVIKKSGSLSDTLYRIDDVGFHSPKGKELGADTKDYDGWNIKLRGDRFDVWLIRNNGPASDAITIQWVDSTSSFAVEFAPESAFIHESPQ